MTAAMTARALGGRRAGRDWVAPCPAHNERTPSFSLRDAEDGKVLLRCHAGCGQRDVIAALRERGLWGGLGCSKERIPNAARRRHCEDADRTAQKAAAVGWSIIDGFGFHPKVPTARYDAMGLVPLIRGGEVLDIRDDRAVIRNRSGNCLKYYLRRHGQEAVPIWELATKLMTGANAATLSPIATTPDLIKTREIPI